MYSYSIGKILGIDSITSNPIDLQNPSKPGKRLVDVIFIFFSRTNPSYLRDGEIR